MTKAICARSLRHFGLESHLKQSLFNFIFLNLAVKALNSPFGENRFFLFLHFFERDHSRMKFTNFWASFTKFSIWFKKFILCIVSRIMLKVRLLKKIFTKAFTTQSVFFRNELHKTKNYKVFPKGQPICRKRTVKFCSSIVQYKK